MQFEAIGTHWSIETPHVLDHDLEMAISERIERFDKTYSRFRSDSLICEMESGRGEFTFPEDVVDLIDFYEKLYRATDGSVTPLVGETLSALGYDKTYTFQERCSVLVPSWENVMKWRGARVSTTQPVTLDFGAAGKGYLVDIIGVLLESAGIQEYTIDASGDIRHRGDNYSVVGLENPHDTSRVIGTLRIKNQSLCASAINRRRWGNGLHHIVDGKTGRIANDVVATWVTAETTMIADGFATALFFVSPDTLVTIAPFQYIRLFSNDTVEHSKEFMGELFI